MGSKNQNLSLRAAGASIVLLFGGTASAFALSLEEAVRAMWAKSPQLEAQREQSRLAERDRWRRFMPNEPQLLYTNADDRANVGWGVGETFAFPGKSLALAGLDSARARAERAELHAKRYELARLAAQTYLDAASARAAVGIQRRNAEDSESLAQTLKARYQAGQAAQAETIAADLQLRQLKADLEAQADHAAASERRLAQLLELPAGSDLTLELPDDLPPALAGELSGPTPDRLRAESAQDLAGAQRRTALWSQLPDFSVNAVRNHYLYPDSSSPNGKGATWTFGAVVTLPLLFPLWEGAEASRAKSQAVIDGSAARLSALAAESDANEAAREYARSRARLAQIRGQDLSLAEALMESTLSSYKTGKLGFAELVLARKTLSDIRAQEVQLRGTIIAARLRCLDRCVAAQETKP